MGMVLVDQGALAMAMNALRRDAAEGKLARGEMADEIEKTCQDASGRVPLRFAWLINQLRERFPGAADPLSSRPAELALLEALDARLNTTPNV